MERQSVVIWLVSMSIYFTSNDGTNNSPIDKWIKYDNGIRHAIWWSLLGSLSRYPSFLTSHSNTISTQASRSWKPWVYDLQIKLTSWYMGWSAMQLGQESQWWRHLGYTLQWRYNERGGVSYHQPHDCLLNRLFRRISKKTSKLCITGLCGGNSPVTSEFPAQRASDAEKFPFNDVIMIVLYGRCITSHMESYAPSHHLNQCWLIVTWTLGNKFQWNLHQKYNNFRSINGFENVVCKMTTILSKP